MRTDGQTDITKLIVAFRNFANAPKNILGVMMYLAEYGAREWDVVNAVKNFRVSLKKNWNPFLEWLRER